MHPSNASSRPTTPSTKLECITYHLVDAGDLGLEDGDGVTNGWLLVGNGSGSESSVGHVDQSLLVRVSRDELRQHIFYQLSLYFTIINLTAANMRVANH